jgi:hypothetical protein
MTLKETLLNATQTAKQVALTTNKKLENIKSDVKNYQEKRKAKNEDALEKLSITRSASLPTIHAVAEELGMDVEELDTSAYVSKGTKGTHLPYGLTEGQIRAKLNATLYRSAAVSKITKGVKGAVNTVNQGRDALRKSGIGKGTMFTEGMSSGSRQLPDDEYSDDIEQGDKLLRKNIAPKKNPVQRQSMPPGWGAQPGMYGIKVPGQQNSKTMTPPGFQELPDMFRMELPQNAKPRPNSLPSYMTQKNPYVKPKKSGKKKKNR